MLQPMRVHIDNADPSTTDSWNVQRSDSFFVATHRPLFIWFHTSLRTMSVLQHRLHWTRPLISARLRRCQVDRALITSHACNLRVSESEVSLTCTDGFLSTLSRFLLMVQGFDVWDPRAALRTTLLVCPYAKDWQLASCEVAQQQ